jgi:hypothetical protein
MATNDGMSLVDAVAELDSSRYRNVHVKDRQDGTNALLVAMTRDLEKCARKYARAIVVIVSDKKVKIPAHVEAEDRYAGKVVWNVSDAHAHAVIQCHPNHVERASGDVKAEMSKYVGLIPSLLVYVDDACGLNDTQAQNLIELAMHVCVNDHTCKAEFVRVVHTRSRIPGRLYEALGRLRETEVKHHYSITRKPPHESGTDK